MQAQSRLSKLPVSGATAHHSIAEQNLDGCYAKCFQRKLQLTLLEVKTANSPRLHVGPRAACGCGCKNQPSRAVEADSGG